MKLLPGFSSSIFTTSNLTSLTLYHTYDDECRYTRSQFYQILQRHPNLQKLDLGNGALPPVEESGTPVPIVLPRLVNLRLYGMEAVVVGFLDLISMSSPLYSVAILLDYTYTPRLSTLARTAETILVPYYECHGLEYPRTVGHLTISRLVGHGLEFTARDYSTPAPYPASTLTLQFRFHGIGEALVPRAIRLSPLKGVRELTVAACLELSVGDWRGMFRELEDLLHLRLDRIPIELVLDALDSAPKLQSLALCNLDIPFPQYQKLLDILEERRNHHIGLECLTVEWCRIHTDVHKADLRNRVERVTWNNGMAPDSFESYGS